MYGVQLGSAHCTPTLILVYELLKARQSSPQPIAVQALGKRNPSTGLAVVNNHIATAVQDRPCQVLR